MSGSGPVQDGNKNSKQRRRIYFCIPRWVRLGPGEGQEPKCYGRYEPYCREYFIPLGPARARWKMQSYTRSIESASGYESSLGPASAWRWIHTDIMRKIKSLWMCVPRWVRLGPGGRWKHDCEAETQNLCLHTSVGPARARREIGN